MIKYSIDNLTSFFCVNSYCNISIINCTFVKAKISNIEIRKYLSILLKNIDITKYILNK